MQPDMLETSTAMPAETASDTYFNVLIILILCLSEFIDRVFNKQL